MSIEKIKKWIEDYVTNRITELRKENETHSHGSERNNEIYGSIEELNRLSTKFDLEFKA